jgi:hypothetical protein
MTRELFEARYRWLLHQEMRAMRELVDPVDAEAFETLYELVAEYVYPLAQQARPDDRRDVTEDVQWKARAAVRKILQSGLLDADA